MAEGGKDDKRAWYLSLHRSFENLEALRDRIENRLIPEMIQVAQTLGQKDLARLTADELLEEIARRREITDHWVQVYWKEFIPFAHGIRLFGQVYNDAVQPGDPYEFMVLLEQTEMKSVERNRRLESLADRVRGDSRLRERLVDGQPPRADSDFERELAAFIGDFGDLSCPVTGGTQCRQGDAAIVQVVLKLAEREPRAPQKRAVTEIEGLKQRFLDCLAGDSNIDGDALLALGRSSYQLRDDDNIHLGKIESRLREAAQEAQRRIEDTDCPLAADAHEALKAVVDAQLYAPPVTPSPFPEHAVPGMKARVRQLTGQPAGPGIASGPARVISKHGDLMSFRDGEVLIVDAVDPNMTFVVPLAAGIVERRGGMLIHGAIIAREYGIACVTGVPDAVARIDTGDHVIVDGFLGIVTVDKSEA